MLWDNRSLTDVLLSKRNATVVERVLLDEVRILLNRDETARQAIKQRLHEGGDGQDANNLVFDLLESGRIFHIQQIREVCIDYRLRFLGSELYKSTIPEEAVTEIKHLEKEHGTVLGGFKIMAPSQQFYLENYDDPLLFAPIGNGYYYLIHKWGNDLNPLRKIIVRPMRDFGSLLVFLLMVSLVFTLGITRLLFYGTETGQFVLVAFLFAFKSFCGIALYYCFWKGKNFNVNIWDSPYYNK
jgi:hypothetical protein